MIASNRACKGSSRNFRRLAVILLLGCLPVSAQELFYESEPNDTPATADRIRGEINIAGAMTGADQDGFMWSVSDADAETRWTIRLDGIPGKLTLLEVFRVEFAENGVDVVAVEKLFGMGSRDGATPAFQRELLFEPGDYVFGFAQAGGSGGRFRPPAGSIGFGTPADEAAAAEDEENGYRAKILTAGPFRVRRPPNPPLERSSAQNVRPGGYFASFVPGENSWYRVKFSEEHADSLWEVRGQLPVGQEAEVFLRDAEGTELAGTKTDRFGRFLLTDLGLSAGTHFIEVRGEQPNNIRVIEVNPIGRRVQGSEAEDNGSWDTANIVDLSMPVTGRIGLPRDADYFLFTLDESSADQLLDLQLETGQGQSMEACLYDASRVRLQCRKASGSVTLPKLLLRPGQWGVLLRGDEGAEYTLALQARGAIVEDGESEPNDEVELAVSVPAKNRIRGVFDTADDKDFYRFVVTEEAQLWRFQAIGDGLQGIAYYDGAGKRLQEVRDTSRRLRLENVFLMPGQHFIRVVGRPGTDYVLIARPLGPPDPDGEREPNDDVRQMQPLDMGQRRNGYLTGSDDVDLYRFTLHDWDRIRVTVEPPVDGSLIAHLYWNKPHYFASENSGVGEPVIYEGLFPPGDYVVGLRGRKISDAEYHLQLDRLDRFGCPVDCEPNSDQAFARPVPASLVVEGSTAGWGGADVYALPVLDAPQELVIRPDEKYRLTVTQANRSENLAAWDEELGAFRVEIPADVMTYVEIVGADDGYRFVLEYPDGPAPSVAATPPEAEIELQMDADTVKAYRQYGQRVDGIARLTNTGTGPLSLELAAATSDRRWDVTLERAGLELASGESREVAVTVHVPKDAWAGRDVRVSLRAANRGGQVTTHRDIGADADVDAASPVHHYSVPVPLRGGFNVAADYLGGRWAGDYTHAVGDRFEEAIDGLAAPGNGLRVRGGYKGDTAELHIDLAGEAPVEIAGVVLHSLSDNAVRDYLRIADVAISLDGENWQQVLFAPMQPIGGEQAFVLEQPVRAAHARLMLEHNWWARPRNGEKLGEFKVIATPGVDISGGEGFNLADRRLGGHVVWARPHIDTGRSNSILSEDKVQPGIRLKAGESLSWVIGFHHQRAALLDRLEWVHQSGDSQARRFDSVQVFASMDTPFGPWTNVGEWKLSADGALDVFGPEAPFWARYLKFTTRTFDERARLAPPAALRAWEVPTSEDYRSVLTEWGYLSREAFWESRNPVSAEPSFARAANDTKGRAAPLTEGETASGAVLLGEHEHWYRVDVPADHNTLAVRLAGYPTVRTVVSAETAGGEPIVLRRTRQEDEFDARVVEAVVEPGSTVFLNVEEPPRNVVFAWDTSPSVAPYIPVIYNALRGYAAQARPGLDAVNFLPFGRNLLMQEWYGEPYVLQTVINEYPRRESSSQAELTLARASRALASREGAKAIVLITDAFTPQYRGGLWDVFEAVRPRIFGLGVSMTGQNFGDLARAYDLMQGWTAINGGRFSQLLSAGELEVAFERAQTLLTEPAPYTLVADTEFREAPGPGTLTVTSGNAADGATTGAVELILDASGSMLKRLGGKRRVTIAKEVLTEAVNDWIPDGTPVALRVFGHREPNDCRTDLEVALAPLDRAAMTETIAGINAMNLAKTPIADSLAAAARDLAKAEGGVSILLLTDGEETCEGDPSEAISTLQEQGIDVTLNIVGFAIDDEATEAQFAEWAAAGGGRYFAANDQAGLSEAVNEALQTPFAVYDVSGARVAEGLVDGDPVTLEAGYYRVVVSGARTQTFEDVEIPGESRVGLELE